MAVRNESPILNEEREFRIEELFFSITDKKGIIEHRNDVFTPHLWVLDRRIDRRAAQYLATSGHATRGVSIAVADD